MTWNPAQYLKFGGARLRPAVDLLSRVALEAPRHVYDLGCGAGQTTSLLAARYPAARIAGIDNSAPMLDAARTTFPELKFVRADIATFTPVPPADLLYANAALHWLPDHATLFPRLLDSLRPGGVLAVQMPMVDRSPRIRVLRELAADPRWADRALAHLQHDPPSPEVFYDMLAPRASALDIWETEYLHVLDGDDPVAEWTRGSGAAPLLAALAPDEAMVLWHGYKAAMREAYPRRPDGTTLLPFRRLFIVVTRR